MSRRGVSGALVGGPAGPQGGPGPTGPTGPAGPAGTALGLAFNALTAWSATLAGYLAFGSTATSTATDDQRFLAARAGTVTAIYVQFLGDPGNAGQTTRFDIQVNGVTQGSSGEISSDAGTQTGSATGLSIPYLAGDTIGIMQVMTGGAFPVTDIKVGIG